jgi:Fur family zinc uptake transcriptional regulator
MIPAVVMEYCAVKGLELTPIRQVLLAHLWEHKVPVKAYDLIEVLRQSGIGSPKPPTVYRTIDFFEGQGLVHKINALNAYLPCHHPGKHQTCQFLICDECENVEEFCDAELSMMIPMKAKKRLFEPRVSFVEVFGRCDVCLGKHDYAE